MTAPSGDVRLFVVMGVAGSGKSSVGAALAGATDGRFLDADDYHPARNKRKMTGGTPLTDEDRWPWLEAFGKALAAENGLVIGACSALKRSYREAIAEAAKEPVHFVFLQGSRDVIGRRMARRRDHFMPPALLDSQFATLEPPNGERNATTVPIDRRFRDVVEAAKRLVQRRYAV